MNYSEKDYTFTITMRGEITISAKDMESALEFIKDNMSKYDLFDYIEEVEVD